MHSYLFSSSSLLLIIHILSWIRPTLSVNSTEIWDLFHMPMQSINHSTENKRESSNINYAEGGIYNNIKNKLSSSTEKNAAAKTPSEGHLLNVGPSEAGNSSVKSDFNYAEGGPLHLNQMNSSTEKNATTHIQLSTVGPLDLGAMGTNKSNVKATVIGISGVKTDLKYSEGETLHPIKINSSNDENMATKTPQSKVDLLVSNELGTGKSSVKAELNYAEGGSINLHIINSSIENSVVVKTPLSKVDLLDLGAPGTGTSGVKARKGVDAIFSNVTQNATDLNLSVDLLKPLSPAPVHENSEIPTILKPLPPHDTMIENHSRKITNTSLPPKTIASFASSVINNNNNSSLKNNTVPANFSLHLTHKKPSITIVPPDSDSLVASLSKDRNVIVPVLALVIAPLLVLLALFIYKRFQDSNGTHYMRMGYLIEDIYND